MPPEHPPLSALITGAGTGIGAAAAHRLAADGYAVTLVGRRLKPLQAEAAAIEAAGGRALAVSADASDEADIARAVAASVEAFGGIDALVVNHGVGGEGMPVAGITTEAWDGVLNVNLRGAFLTARAALPHLVARRGAIVTVASNSAMMAGPGWAAYCTSKAGLVMLTRCLANDYGPLGVRANAVCPGFIRTEMADGAMDAVASAWHVDREQAYDIAHRDVPLRRAGTADEVADLIAFLVSPAANYITGAAVPIDGGATIVDLTATSAIFDGPAVKTAFGR